MVLCSGGSDGEVGECICEPLLLIAIVVICPASGALDDSGHRVLDSEMEYISFQHLEVTVREN